MPRLVALVIAATLAFSGGGCSGCPTALLEGVLVPDGQGGLAVQREGGSPTPVVWPGDAHVTRDGDRLALANTLGAVFAHEGDVIHVGGGENPKGPGFAACGPIAVTPGSASPQ